MKIYEHCNWINKIFLAFETKKTNNTESFSDKVKSFEFSVNVSILDMLLVQSQIQTQLQ